MEVICRYNLPFMGNIALKLGGKVLWQLTTIVAPDTLLRWIRADKKSGKKTPMKRGRRRTREQIRRVILKLAKENHWGYTRILGELKKLGIHSISRNTVKRTMKIARISRWRMNHSPRPKNAGGQTRSRPTSKTRTFRWRMFDASSG